MYYSYVWNFYEDYRIEAVAGHQKPLREHKNSKFILFGSEKRRVTQVDVLIKESLFILLRNNEWDTYLNGKVHQRIFHLLKTYHIKKSTDAICRSHFASFRVRPSNVTELYNKKGMMMTILYQVNWNTTSQRKKKKSLASSTLFFLFTYMYIV